MKVNEELNSDTQREIEKDEVYKEIQHSVNIDKAEKYGLDEDDAYPVDDEEVQDAVDEINPDKNTRERG
ncbi:MAG: hypothetical protein LUG18_01495 [Candidatus Azobacteroides sp.]|nr:hypothetical protein [Candidatus Azobacteroides sp.]